MKVATDCCGVSKGCFGAFVASEGADIRKTALWTHRAETLTVGHLLHVCVRTHVQDRRDGHVVGDLFPGDAAIFERKQNRKAHDKSPSGRTRIA